MIAGVVVDPQRREAYTANNDIEDTVVVMPYEATGNQESRRASSRFRTKLGVWRSVARAMRSR